MPIARQKVHNGAWVASRSEVSSWLVQSIHILYIRSIFGQSLGSLFICPLRGCVLGDWEICPDLGDLSMSKEPCPRKLTPGMWFPHAWEKRPFLLAGNRLEFRTSQTALLRIPQHRTKTLHGFRLQAAVLELRLLVLRLVSHIRTLSIFFRAYRNAFTEFVHSRDRSLGCTNSEGNQTGHLGTSIVNRSTIPSNASEIACKAKMRTRCSESQSSRKKWNDRASSRVTTPPIGPSYQS